MTHGMIQFEKLKANKIYKCAFQEYIKMPQDYIKQAKLMMDVGFKMQSCVQGDRAVAWGEHFC